MGTVVGTMANGESKCESVNIPMDVIQLDIPLLISNASLKAMDATLDFPSDKMWITKSMGIPLMNTGGHICFDWRPTKCAKTI